MTRGNVLYVLSCIIIFFFSFFIVYLHKGKYVCCIVCWYVTYLGTCGYLWFQMIPFSFPFICTQALLDAITDTDPDTATPRRQPVMSSDASAPPNWATAGQVPLTSLPAQAGGGTLGTTPLLHFVYRHVATQQAVSSMVDDALMGSLQQVRHGQICKYM